LTRLQKKKKDISKHADLKYKKITNEDSLEDIFQKPKSNKIRTKVSSTEEITSEDSNLSKELQSKKKNTQKPKNRKNSEKVHTPETQWITEEDVNQMAISKGMKKCFELVQNYHQGKHLSEKRTPKKSKIPKRKPSENIPDNHKLEDMLEKIKKKNATKST